MRTANFTSSEIWKLMTDGQKKGTFGKPFYTYIQEKKWELKLGRSISTNQSSRETSWGNLVETRAFDLLGLQYVHQSDVRYQHTDLPWSGAPDMITEDSICDIKCPFTLKSFCQQMDFFFDLERFRDEKPEYYWQLVSNAILAGMTFAEFIVYVPYRGELKAIREMCEYFLGDANKVAWINWASDDELPFLYPDGDYKNLNVWRFEVPNEDKELLIERVKIATEILNQK